MEIDDLNFHSNVEKNILQPSEMISWLHADD